MFNMGVADVGECEQFLDWVKENYHPEEPEKKEAVDILSEYYVTRELPLCGMKSWFKRDYDRFCRGDKHVVERHKPHPSTPSTSKNKTETWATTDNPGWRGPNGTWSLD